MRQGKPSGHTQAPAGGQLWVPWPLEGTAGGEMARAYRGRTRAALSAEVKGKLWK